MTAECAGCVAEPVSGLTDVVVSMVAKSIRCAVVALYTMMEGHPSERAEATRRVFVAAVDRALAEVTA